MAAAIIHLMRGVVYREHDENTWTALDRHAPAVRDHFAAIGVDVIVDDTEGYAYLQQPAGGRRRGAAAPAGRPGARLTYNVSLLLVLLRKRLVEFETPAAKASSCSSREQIVEMLRLFLAESTNEARVVDQVDTHHPQGRRTRLPAAAARAHRPVGGAPHPQGLRRRADAVRLRGQAGRVRRRQHAGCRRRRRR